MSTTVNLPIAQAADIIEGVVATMPKFRVGRSVRADGSMELQLMRMSYSNAQGCLSILLFPIGLIVLAFGKNTPRDGGQLVLANLGSGVGSRPIIDLDTDDGASP